MYGMKKDMILTIIISIIVIAMVVVYIYREEKSPADIHSNDIVQSEPQAILENVQTTNPNNEQKNMDTKELVEQTAVFSTTLGDFTVAFYKESPKTVENFVKLAKAGFYNGVKFHRVIKDFMIQSGDPLSKDDGLKAQWGTGGPGYQFADEFNSHKLVRGSLAMANSGPNTNGSQFFIVTAEATPWLDGKHTNFGYVTDGMDVVLKIENTQTGPSDRPVVDVVVKSITVK